MRVRSLWQMSHLLNVQPSDTWAYVKRRAGQAGGRPGHVLACSPTDFPTRLVDERVSEHARWRRTSHGGELSCICLERRPMTGGKYWRHCDNKLTVTIAYRSTLPCMINGIALFKTTISELRSVTCYIESHRDGLPARRQSPIQVVCSVPNRGSWTEDLASSTEAPYFNISDDITMVARPHLHGKMSNVYVSATCSNSRGAWFEVEPIWLSGTADPLALLQQSCCVRFTVFCSMFGF